MQRGIAYYFNKKPNESDAPSPSSLSRKRKTTALSSDEDDSQKGNENVKNKKKRIAKNANDHHDAKAKIQGVNANSVDPSLVFGGPTTREKKTHGTREKVTNPIKIEMPVKNSVSPRKIKKNDENPAQCSSHRPKNSPKPLETESCHLSKSTKENIFEDTEGKRETKSVMKKKNQPLSHSKSKALDRSMKRKCTTLDNETDGPNKQIHSDLDTSVLSDEERFERKRAAAMLYQKYKNRQSVINPGSKEVPKGKPNCLAGISFLVTGVLESIERDEANSIIKELGGKVSSTVGKRLNYLIAGEDAGPKKLADAETFNIPILNVDDFFDLIREKSSDQNKKVEIKTEPLEDKPLLRKEIDQGKQNKVEGEVSKSVEEKPKLVTVQQEVNEIINDDSTLTWVEKYKPSSVKQIIGQQGPGSNATKLKDWLTNWHSNHNGKKKLQKPNPWSKNDDGSYFKAALLSGPPGVGKTTTAMLVCKELGFDAIEFNASDTRSKRLLKEEVSELLSNKSLYGYFHDRIKTVSKKHILIMDEVDGMAGNEDRGGIQELIALIKDAHVPIICMCNDRNHQKMRSLVNYCYDLRFNRPRLEQIKGFIKSICFKEKVKLNSEKIDEIIQATNNDIRQTVNHISLLSAGKAQSDESLQVSSQRTAQKDLKIGPWEIVRKVFSAEEHKKMSLADKSDLFFHDYSMTPLFVQQNYLIVSPIGPKSEVLRKISLTADALSVGDLIDTRVRSNSAWTLLPTQAIFSSVLPGEYMEGHITGQINFPGWLGKYSRSNKRKRIAQEIHDHTRLRTSGSRLSIRIDYAQFLLSHIVRPLKENGLEGVGESLKILQEYRLLREDIDSLIELTTWPGKKSLMDAVDGRVKAALTKAYNKEVLPYSYSLVSAIKKKKTDIGNMMEFDEEEEVAIAESENDGEDDSVENDNLIKAKKKKVSSTSKSSTSTGKKASGPPKSKAGLKKHK